MRTIEREICNVIESGKDGCDRRVSERDRVWKTEGSTLVFLHNTKIVQIAEGKMQLFARGWRSATTKSRLNAMLRNFAPQWRIVQKNFDWKVYNSKTGEVKEFEDGIEFTIA